MTVAYLIAYYVCLMALRVDVIVLLSAPFIFLLNRYWSMLDSGCYGGVYGMWQDLKYTNTLRS